MKILVRLLATAFLLAPMTGATLAQSQDQGSSKQTKKETYAFTVTSGQTGGEGGMVATTGAPGQNTFVYVSSEMSFDGTPVKGAPYSAQTVRTFTQTLSDGNRISRQSTGMVYRDSEGRTRREESFGAMGPWSAQNDAPQTIFINDPVAGVNYVLNPSEHTASKITFGPMTQTEGALKKKAEALAIAGADSLPPPPPPGEGMSTMVIKRGDGEGNMQFFHTSDTSNTKTEQLGTQSFDGVDAQGTRTTLTIPAGKIGNDLPINIVDERWYSPALKVVVMSRHSDPQTGESTYKLAGISRDEPSASLFTVPSDYAVKEGPARMRFEVRKHAPLTTSNDQQQ